MDNKYGLEQGSFHIEMAANPKVDDLIWNVGKMVLLIHLVGKATIIIIIFFSITLTDGVLSSVAVLVAVVCWKAALPSGQFAIIMLSVCLKSEEHPYELSEYRSIYLPIYKDRPQIC